MSEDLLKHTDPAPPESKDLEQLVELLLKKEQERFLDVLKTIYPVDFVEAWDELAQPQQLLLFRAFPKDYAAEFFSYLDQDEQIELVDRLSKPELASVLDNLYTDDMADILGELPANVVRRIMQVTPIERRRQVNRILEYPESSAGALMTSEALELKAHQTVFEALESLRSLYRKAKIEEVYHAFILSPGRILVGVTSVREIMSAEDDVKIADLMREEVISVRTDSDANDATRLMQRYDLIALPVVDLENRLVGLITIDDALDHMTETMTEDIAMMAGVTPSEEEYLKTPLFDALRHRLPWLLLFMVGGFIAGWIILAKSDLIRIYPLLVCFIPLLLTTGSSAGSQTTSLLARALSLHEVEAEDEKRILGREALLGLLSGLFLGVLALLISKVFFPIPWALAAALGLSMMLAIFFAKALGSFFPLLGRRIHVDPSVASTPLQTSLTELASLLLYFFFLEMFIKLFI